MIFETPRLLIRIATPADADMYYQLWTNPRVMANVGFPNGLPITREEIEEQLAGDKGDEFDRRLVVLLKATGQRIGECKLGRVKEDGIAETDVKLLPDFWGHKYGVEIKRGLVDYLFIHTDCAIIQATPNTKNIASIKMQEAVGGVRVDEYHYEFPSSMRGYTTPIHGYVYHVRREDWESNQGKQVGK